MTQKAKTPKEELASKLKSARELAGLSQSQVAKKLGYHRPTISEIEACRRDVSAEEVVKFAEMYGVSTDWLLSQKEAEIDNPQISVAARELSRISNEDLDRLMKVIQILRKPSSN